VVLVFGYNLSNFLIYNPILNTNPAHQGLG